MASLRNRSISTGKVEKGGSSVNKTEEVDRGQTTALICLDLAAVVVFMDYVWLLSL